MLNIGIILMLPVGRRDAALSKHYLFDAINANSQLINIQACSDNGCVTRSSGFYSGLKASSGPRVSALLPSL